jgi:hypothetical protein
VTHAVIAPGDLGIIIIVVIIIIIATTCSSPRTAEAAHQFIRPNDPEVRRNSTDAARRDYYWGRHLSDECAVSF